MFLNFSNFKTLIIAVYCLSGVVIAFGQTTLVEPAIDTTLVQSRNFQDQLQGSEGVIIVPENREDPSSRMISVHYFRFPARETVGLLPVFFLPGGPGQCITATDIQRGLQQKRYNKIAEIVAFNQNHDVIIVNQRGNNRVPGIHGLPSTWSAKPGKSSEPMSLVKSSQRLEEGLRASLTKCKSLNIDTRGYDILHLVDDVDAIRRVYGYEKIALRGSSFGSQWALAYLKQNPKHVDRMILSGIEPLNHGYDSANGIWNVFKRIEDEARKSKDIKLPDMGLLGAVQTIIARLEEQPVRIRGRHPRKNHAAEIVIGADDFRYYLTRPILDSQMHSRKMLELWPKFVLEVYREDYQYLAAKIIDDRPEYDHRSLLLTLVDNSLGITENRERKLQSESAYRWLGDLNWFYKATRHITPTPVVSDEFRQPIVNQTPVLMIHGTLDLATPIENAEELLPYFPKGHLITVKGGTHAATHHAASIDSNFLKYLSVFMNINDPASAFKQFPNTISLPALQLKNSNDRSLFSELTRKKD